MAKVSVIGAGNVGATCVNAMLHLNFCSDIVLLDIRQGFAEGKAMDMMQTSKIYQFNTRLVGVTNDYKATANSDVVIVTSGMPRKPGMTREELIGVNAKIVSDVTANVLKYSPNCIFEIIANPMDPMTYLTLKKNGLSKHRVVGMGGLLDTSRFTYYLSRALDVPVSDIEGMVIGGHGDKTMIPLIRMATYKGIPITSLLTSDECNKVVADTMVGGATLTKLIGTSAWYAPGVSAATMAKSIIQDDRKMFPCCCYLEGEYGQKDICIGVPAILGKDGWEKVVEFDLNAEEKKLFAASADATRSTAKILYDQKLI
jgi:malate dehydrogenase